MLFLSLFCPHSHMSCLLNPPQRGCLDIFRTARGSRMGSDSPFWWPFPWEIHTKLCQKGVPNPFFDPILIWKSGENRRFFSSIFAEKSPISSQGVCIVSKRFSPSFHTRGICRCGFECSYPVLFYRGAQPGLPGVGKNPYKTRKIKILRKTRDPRRPGYGQAHIATGRSAAQKGPLIGVIGT